METPIEGEKGSMEKSAAAPITPDSSLEKQLPSKDTGQEPEGTSKVANQKEVPAKTLSGTEAEAVQKLPEKENIANAASSSVDSIAKPPPDSFLGKIEELGSEFITGQEWGLFGGRKFTPDKLKETIIEQLGKARAAVAKKDLVAQQTAYLEAKDAFCVAQRRRPAWYLGNTRFGVLPIVYTAVSSSFAYYVVFRYFAPSTFDQTLHNAAFWGLVGGILKSLYWMQFQINRGLLRPRWLAYFLVAPIIGIILGAISSLIVKVGLKLFKSGADVQTDWRVIALFAAFAGFNWEWALEKFKYTADAVWSHISDRKSNGSGKGNAP